MTFDEKAITNKGLPDGEIFQDLRGSSDVP
jgi:hypothetical protein